MPTNMDIKKNKTATAPILEFSLPISEVDAILKIEDEGILRIPVEVVDVSNGMITFRKDGKVMAEEFREEKLESMRERIGEVEDAEESPTKKSYED